MKQAQLLMSVYVVILSFFTFSCETVKGIIGTPSISLEDVKIKSLDLEGITFACDYAIKNPYPISISIKEVAADILCDTKIFTKLNTDGGVKIAANKKQTNALDFKIPYTSILNFAKSISEKEALPFSVKGNVGLDLSLVKDLGFDDIVLPFSKEFDVPIVKPEFSVSDVKLQLPTLSALVDSLVHSGLALTKATQLANALITKQKITADIFDGVDLNLDIVCNLNVKSNGSSAWNFLLNNCSLKTSTGSLIALLPVGTNKINSASGTIPLKASINTIKVGTFVAQLINKSGTNPVFSFESGLTFPSLSYVPNIPLAYSYEIPLSKINVGN